MYPSFFALLVPCFANRQMWLSCHSHYATKNENQAQHSPYSNLLMENDCCQEKRYYWTDIGHQQGACCSYLAQELNIDNKRQCRIQHADNKNGEHAIHTELCIGVRKDSKRQQ